MKKLTPDDFTKFLISPDPTPTDPGSQAEPISPRDEHLLKIIDECYSQENIEVKTDLNDAQIKAITKAKAFNLRFNCPFIETISQNIMILSVSRGRKGREEFAKIATSMTPQMPVQEVERPTISERLWGGRREY